MRKALESIFLVLFTLTGQAQINFNNVYDYNEEAQFARGVFICSDSNYLSIAVSANYDTLFQGMLISKINKSGNLINQLSYSDSNLDYYIELHNSIHQINPGLLYSAVSKFNHLTFDSDIDLVTFNCDLDSFHTYDYPTPSFDITYSSYITMSNYFLIAGGTAESGSGIPDFVLYKIDSSYNLQWVKAYGGSGYDIALNVFQQNGNSIIISGIKNLTPIHETTWILKLDSTGTILNQKEFNYQPYLCKEGRFTFLNENYLMVGCLDTVYNLNDDPNPVYIAKLDTGFNVIWRTDFHGPETRAISIPKQLPDSSIVFIGEKYTFAGIPLGWIAKLNKEGHVLWEHTYYKKLTIDNYFADFQQTYDKGFIVTGSAFGPTQDVWLVKLDSMGCLDPNDCTFNTGTIEVGQEVISLNVFPNPAASQITLLYNLPISATDAVISFFDLTGRLIHQVQPNPSAYEVNIDVSVWNNGMYICNLEVAGQSVKSMKVLVIH